VVYLALLSSVGLRAEQAVAVSLMVFGYITLYALAGGVVHFLTPAPKRTDSPR